jgi:hypothetical protein
MLLLPAFAAAQSVTLAWDPSPTTDNVVGYTVHVGINSGSYGQTFDVAGRTNTTFTFTQVTPGQRYYFVVSAYRADNVQSPLSSQVSWKLNVGPTLTQPSPQVGAVGAATSLQLSATDDGDPLTYSATGLPNGLSISSSGVISGTPTVAGSFTVNATVSDGSLTSTRSFPWTIGPALSVTSLTGAPASPQVSGTPITLTAAATGGIATYQYKFLASLNGGSATTLRTWGTSATHTWTPSSAGSYVITVWARSAGVTADAAEASRTLNFTVSPAPLTVNSLTANPASPREVNTAITLSASASNGTAPYQYKFLSSLNGGAQTTLRNWGSSANFTWTPTTAGTYVITVWARSSGNTADAAEAQRTLNYTITPAPVPPTPDAVSPSSGSGATQTFQLTYSDTLGAARISTAWVWINTTLTSTSANSCLTYYDRSASRLYLIDDAGTNWTSGTLGSAGTLSNSSCSINRATSSVAVSGTTFTMNLAATFSSAFSGAKNVYMYVASGSMNSGWQARGTWTVPGGGGGGGTPAVTADSSTPSSGSTGSQTFALRYSDTTGAANLATAWVWFNQTMSSSSANSCLAYYERGPNRLNLIDDSGSGWRSATLGSGTLANSSCSINLAGSSAVVSGNVLTLNLATTFMPAFAGSKNIYMYAANSSLNSGWHSRGTWTVPGGGGGGTPAVTADSSTPNAGSTATQTFALRYSDTTGGANITTGWVWFNATMASTSANSCLMYYDRAAHRLFMTNDAGTAWASGAVGSSGTLQNSQCAVDLAAASASPSGTTLTVTLPVTFRPAYAGTKNIYMYGANAVLNSGWQTRGTWTVPGGGAPPTVGVTADSVAPVSGSGMSELFTLRYSDSNGANHLRTAWVWFNATFASSSANSCLVYYDRAADRLFLINDAGTQWLSVAGGTLQNSQCSIDIPGSSVSATGNTLTLGLAITFKSPFAGAKNVYMYAEALGGTNSAWQTRGSWTVQ